MLPRATVTIQTAWDKIKDIFYFYTGKDYEQVVKDTDRDNFMSADEALEYGLIDKIFTNRA